jgi:hypothetical protein
MPNSIRRTRTTRATRRLGFAAAALAAAFLSAAAVQAATPKASKPPMIQLDYEKYTLPNGLDVILRRDPRVPMVAVNLWYHVGPANETAGLTGRGEVEDPEDGLVWEWIYPSQD